MIIASILLSLLNAPAAAYDTIRFLEPLKAPELVRPAAAAAGPSRVYVLDEKKGALLVFDEVISGFRASRGGAQQLLGVRPDLTCLGKIIGGGLPVGAYGGRADIMDKVAPAGPVYQAGTLSGNPLAMAAGAATLDVLLGTGIYARLESLTRRLCGGLERAAAGEMSVELNVNIRPLHLSRDEMVRRLAGNICAALTTISATTMPGRRLGTWALPLPDPDIRAGESWREREARHTDGSVETLLSHAEGNKAEAA